MIVVDTSVWVDHFRNTNPRLVALLNDAQVLTHPFVIGELTCGNLPSRSEVLRLLDGLPGSPVASHAEVMQFVRIHRLHGTGLGWIDVHLLTSAALGGARLFTLDRRLAAAHARIAAK